jgi:hypothetical protein
MGEARRKSCARIAGRRSQDCRRTAGLTLVESYHGMRKRLGPADLRRKWGQDRRVEDPARSAMRISSRRPLDRGVWLDRWRLEPDLSCAFRASRKPRANGSPSPMAARGVLAAMVPGWTGLLRIHARRLSLHLGAAAGRGQQAFRPGARGLPSPPARKVAGHSAFQGHRPLRRTDQLLFSLSELTGNIWITRVSE